MKLNKGDQVILTSAGAEYVIGIAAEEDVDTWSADWFSKELYYVGRKENRVIGGIKHYGIQAGSESFTVLNNWMLLTKELFKVYKINKTELKNIIKKLGL